MINSRHPLVCATLLWLPTKGSSFSRSYRGNLPSSFNIIRSIAWVYSTSPPVSVWGTVLLLVLFPGTSSQHLQSNKKILLTTSVTASRLRNINLIPIDYAFRPRLRGRLTLRGLTWRRNPWTFGGRASHTPYTLLMSAFSLLISPAALTDYLHRLTERSATTCQRHVRIFSV